MVLFILLWYDRRWVFWLRKMRLDVCFVRPLFAWPCYSVSHSTNQFPCWHGQTFEGQRNSFGEQQRKPQWCDYHKFTIPPPHLKYCTKHHNNISHHLHYCSWNDSDKNNAESEKMSCCVRYTYDVQEHKTISHSLSFTNKMSQPLYVKTYGTQTQTHTCST